ncbi:MAG: biosynthetic-type acetolactate synthase large subunit [Eggerthellales bacterium]|nr:biosynthetic-type acetolactate synthase large subunit [Eggerthellales bacterium]
MENEVRNALTVGAAKGAGCHSSYEGQTMTGAQSIIAALECEGVSHVFGYPGAQAIAIYDALYDSKQITHVLARHEQAAVHEADGFARSTGCVGVALVTSGPGATNTVTGIANAYLDSIPLVVITGQVPSHVIGTDAFQESDTISITMPVVKHSYLAQSAEDLPRIIREAFHIAITGRPGPVVIDVPSDVAGQTLVFKYPEKVNIPSYKPTYKCNAKQVKAACALIEQSEKPVIIAGGGVISSGAERELAALAQTVDAPVAVTLMGKGAFPNNDMRCLGAVGMHGSDRSNAALMESDLLIAVGSRLSDRVTGNMEKFAPGAKLIHIDIDPAEIGKLREADVPIVGDAGAVLAGMLSQLQKDEYTGDHTAWWKQINGKNGLVAPAEQGDAIDACACMEALGVRLAEAEKAGKRTIVTTEVGQHQMWAAQYLPRNASRSFLSSGGLGAMGFGFPAAIGASLACPEAQVICVAGDGSLQMNIQEMATARAYNAPVKVLLMNNGCLGMVHQWQQYFYDGRYSQTELDFNPDFIALAAAYGWKGRRVETSKQFGEALDEMLACDGPYLLDVAIPVNKTVLPMVQPGSGLLDRVKTDLVEGE